MTERLLSKILDQEPAQQIMEEIRGPSGRTMWDKLGNVNEGVLANYLKNEYPQTVAVVLSKIKPAHAARVLSLLPENFAIEVVMRMLRMETVQKEILDHVERTLRTEFMTNLARTHRRDSHETDGRDLQQLRSRHRRSVHVGTGGAQPGSGAIGSSSLMFTFDDLRRARRRRHSVAAASGAEGASSPLH